MQYGGSGVTRLPCSSRVQLDLTRGRAWNARGTMNRSHQVIFTEDAHSSRKRSPALHRHGRITSYFNTLRFPRPTASDGKIMHHSIPHISLLHQLHRHLSNKAHEKISVMADGTSMGFMWIPSSPASKTTRRSNGDDLPASEERKPQHRS